MIVVPLPSDRRPDVACAAFLDAPYPLLLDSAGGLPSVARYSYLTADPFLTLRVDAHGVWIDDGQGERRRDGDPFAVLAELLVPYHLPLQEGLPPFQGGAAGYWSYELGRYLERLPGRAAEDLPLPRLCIGLYDWALAYDHAAQRGWLLATGWPSGTERAARRRVEWAQERLAGLDRQPERHNGRVNHNEAHIADEPHVAEHQGQKPTRVEGATFTRATYEAAVRRVKEYIAAGDVYQVNLSQRLHAALPCAPWPLYERLRRASAAPFGAFLGLPGGSAILSASPELFVRVQGRRVETRPIKGTRPRGVTPAQDAALRAELRSSEKDRAENLMIVDLLRNDLGRVCAAGSVRVSDLFAVEQHPTVWQQVSTVTGLLAAGAGALDLLRACFPGGSVTGAPKIRAMEVIDELEPVARGVYCGAIGYVAFNGAMETSIPIRTIVATGGRAYLNVGGGIVADSDPAAEYVETLDKARGALLALRATYDPA